MAGLWSRVLNDFYDILIKTFFYAPSAGGTVLEFRSEPCTPIQQQQQKQHQQHQ
jgi:hypothetical protein